MLTRVMIVAALVAAVLYLRARPAPAPAPVEVADTGEPVDWWI